MAAPPGGAGPFARDVVVVPSAAVRQSVTLALARHQGICSHVDFAYLARWLWQQLARVLPGVGAESPLAAEPLVWRIHVAFGDTAFTAAHARLRRYLDGSEPRARLEFARLVARQFEQLATYRADWLTRWQADPSATVTDGHADEAWQAALWRRLAGELELPGRHPLQRFVAALDAGAPMLAQRCGLPPVVHVFVPPAIPPLHLGWLQQLARGIDVELYLLNPCREYWFDLVDPRRLAWLDARGRAAGHEVVQPLLAGWGRQTQALFDGLLAHDDTIDLDGDFAPLGGTSLLHRLHDAVLTLDPLAPGSLADADRPPGDRSVELHVCHSLTRELEVLHERLLGLFAVEPALQAADVLVALPDLEAAAPLIDAVFGTVPPARRIPYRITGRPRSVVDAPARALLALLALPTSRVGASQVFALLQQPLVARRFGIADDDALQRMHGWIEASGMRWGLDAAHRDAVGVPAGEGHTLAQGLERLLLGYALPGDGAAGPVPSTAEAAAAAFGLLPAG
ncbi:MAG: exodeoxyribonuclease V subunit gamma, partial [Rubrivivax sp.]